MKAPVFGHGELRLYLLKLLDESPRHGYELMQDIEASFGGTYVPSAGTIYPRLAKLEEDGLVTKQTDGRKSVYAITDAGRAELAARRLDLDGIERELSDSVRRLAGEVRASVTASMKTLRADLAAAARDARDEQDDEERASGTPGDADRDSHRRERAAQTSVRVASRERLQEAEAAITQFRHQLRSDLRRQVVDGTLDASTVDLLRTGLDDVRRRVTESLQPR